MPDKRLGALKVLLGTGLTNKTRIAALCLFVGLAGGCRSWRELPPASSGERSLSKNSRITRVDQVRVEMRNGEMTADSVIGDVRGGRVAIPRDSVARIQEYRLNWRRSAAFGIVVWLGAAYMISGPEAVGL